MTTPKSEREEDQMKRTRAGLFKDIRELNAEVSRLTRQLGVAIYALESAATPTACDMHGISDSCAVNLAKQTLQEIEKIKDD